MCEQCLCAGVSAGESLVHLQNGWGWGLGGSMEACWCMSCMELISITVCMICVFWEQGETGHENSKLAPFTNLSVVCAKRMLSVCAPNCKWTLITFNLCKRNWKLLSHQTHTLKLSFMCILTSLCRELLLK